jgi:hypothetical protein
VTTPNDERAVRAAKNQSLFRDINERIKALNEAFDLLTPTATWVCECASLTCVEQIELTLAEYEVIRDHGARFPIAPGHEVPDVEQVVERHDRYFVVEKIGVARQIAEARSPTAG